ncbi:unnamed protein product [Caenorhabditis auriculariae]|uniref:Uncharacterized protein n=1 Tax=Caenorhabditis auriculariae TaxID=2777116 RepID=A0A8S1H9M2_9PELO|nr:unnamed protein product [Caenorhabditis auriculariae]
MVLDVLPVGRVVVSNDSFAVDTGVCHLCCGFIHIMEAMRPEQEEIRYGDPNSIGKFWESIRVPGVERGKVRLNFK